MKRGYLAADGFGSEFCYLEAEAREEVSQLVFPTTPLYKSLCVRAAVALQEACELWKCTFQLEEALSVHALSNYRQKKVCI